MEVLPFLNDPNKRDLLKPEARWEAEEALKLSAIYSWYKCGEICFLSSLDSVI
jgi:hypothetical protein